ncbi:MAG: cyclic nucleotide-binding domain-containing protein [Proteobacteria bacterium]|nr:cyclic nucleotide-binding domain-containing protein [Pseudomonadota bacterium]
MPIVVSLAETQEEREAAYRLRYEVYVEELHRAELPPTDERRIEEPWDAGAAIFVARDGDRTVGTARYTRRAKGELEHEEHLLLPRFSPWHPNQISMLSKLLVLKQYRRSGVLAHLAAAAFRHAYQCGDLVNFIVCRPHLLRLYQSIGYRIYSCNFQLSPGGVSVVPMVMLIGNNSYLEEIRSPLLAYSKKYGEHPEMQAFFSREFPEYAALRPLWLMSEEAFNIADFDAVRTEDASAAPIFRGLESSVIASLLRRFDVLSYESLHWVFRQGDHSDGMFVVLSGSFDAVRHGAHVDHVVGSFVPGDVFGEMGFLSDRARSASVRAAGPSKLLVLSASEYQKLAKQEPALALTLMSNLFQMMAERFHQATDTRSHLLAELEALRSSRPA